MHHGQSIRQVHLQDSLYALPQNGQVHPVDRLSIGDSVKGILIVKLCNRVQGSKKSVLLCAVRRVCSRCQRLASFSSVRKRSCSFTINNVGCDGKDGCGWLGITIGMDVFQLLKECGKQSCCDLVCSVIIVTITWEVTLNLEVCCDSVLVTDCFYFCTFDSGKGIYTCENPAIPVAKERSTFVSISAISAAS